MGVLIVDDAMFLRILLKDIFKNNGYDVIGEASDGYDAIKKYSELRPSLVTLDITMPSMNGIEALQKILEIDPDAIVIMCSAMGRNDFIEEALKLGAKGFITKPFKEDTIIEEVERVLKEYKG